MQCKIIWPGIIEEEIHQLLRKKYMTSWNGRNTWPAVNEEVRN